MLIEPFETEEGLYELVCDHCSNKQIIQAETESELMLYLNSPDNDWMKRRIDKEWVHFCCNECFDDFEIY